MSTTLLGSSLWVGLLSSLFVLSSIEPAQAAGKTYRLECRGGENVEVRWKANFLGGKLQYDQLVHIYRMDIIFKASKFAAKTGKLEPGSCAWRTRRMNKKELSYGKVVIRIEKAPFPLGVDFNPSTQKMSEIRFGQITAREKKQGSLAKILFSPRAAMGDSNRLFYFHVVNKGGRMMMKRTGK